MGAKVTGFALPPPTNPSLFELAKVAGGMKSVIGDIRNYEFLSEEILKAQPEIIIHMAAQPLVGYSYINPIETYSTNVMGTVNILEAARYAPNLRAIVNVTTDKCYENKEWEWGYRESEPLGGHDPYSSSKACSELVTAAYRNSFFKKNENSRQFPLLASARAGNVIGGGDWAKDRLIPDIMRSIEGGETLNIRSPHSIRPWQHVLEPICGYLTLAESLYNKGEEFEGSWNFGPPDDDARPVSWILENFQKYWGDNLKIEIDSRIQYHEAKYLKLDCSKAKARLGWSSSWNLEKTLLRISNWHKSYMAGLDVREVAINDINDYEKNIYDNSPKHNNSENVPVWKINRQ